MVCLMFWQTLEVEQNQGRCRHSAKGGMLYEDTWSINISIWQKHLNKTNNNGFYKLKCLKLCNNISSILSTQSYAL